MLKLLFIKQLCILEFSFISFFPGISTVFLILDQWPQIYIIVLILHMQLFVFILHFVQVQFQVCFLVFQLFLLVLCLQKFSFSLSE